MTYIKLKSILSDIINIDKITTLQDDTKVIVLKDNLDLIEQKVFLNKVSNKFDIPLSFLIEHEFNTLQMLSDFIDDIEKK